MTLPFWAYGERHGWVFGDLACKITSGIYILGLCSYMAFLTAMMLDHYVSVAHAVSLSAQRMFCAHVASFAIRLVCAAASLLETVTMESKDHEFGEFGGFLVVKQSY